MPLSSAPACRAAGPRRSSPRRASRPLVLERGRNVRHVTDYTTALKDPWELPHNNRPTNADRAAQPHPVHALSIRPVHQAVPGRRHEVFVRTGAALQLVSRLPGWRTLAAVGAARVPLQRSRLRGQPERRRGHRLAHSLRGHRAVVRPRGEIHRRQRRESGAAAVAEADPAAAVRNDRAREAHQARDGQGVHRSACSSAARLRCCHASTTDAGPARAAINARAAVLTARTFRRTA